MDILSRKLLLDMPNAAVKFNGGRGQTTFANSFPIFSMCATMAMTQTQFDSMVNFTNFFGYPAGTNYNMLYKNGTNIVWVVYDTINNKFLPLSTGQKTLLLDGNYHRICLIGNNNILKLSIDGTVSTLSTDINTSGYPTTYGRPFMVGFSSNFKGKFSNIKFFNFDISAAGAAYTLDDYQNNRDIPDGISGVILNLHNKLSGTTWQDESGNGHNMTLSGDYEITDE